jgi:hypothetical protein
MSRFSPKARGELVEIQFLLKAASRGLVVAKPWGDTLPFDFLVGRGQRFHRVQVKSASALHCRGGYHVCCSHAANKRPYTRRHTDFLAALIIPEQVWYIIPLSALRRRKTVTVYPRRLPSPGSLEHFLEAWELLER